MMLFQETGRNSERLPLRVWLASHTLVGTLERSIATDQLTTGEEVVFTNLMLPVIPVPQSETTRNSTRTPSIVKSAFGDPLTEGAGVGCGTGVGVAIGVAWGVGVGVACGVVPSVMATMLLAGIPPGPATNPNSTCPPAGIVAFQPKSAILEVEPPAETSLAFQTEERFAGMVRLTDQPVTDEEPVFFTTTAPVNPDPQSESMRADAVRAAKAWVADSAMARVAMSRQWMNLFMVTLE